MLQLLGRLLEATKVSIVLSNRTSVPAACKLFGPSPSPGQFFRVKRDAAAKLRSMVLRACGLTERHVTVPRTVVHMARRGDGLQSGTLRNFDKSVQLRRALLTAIPTAANGTIRVLPTPGPASRTCEQVATWASTDVMLTPNGAHFVNALFMPPGALLIEGVPWSMRAYPGQPHITRWSHIHHVRVYSSKPPPASALQPFERHSERECAMSEVCRHRYRDHANIYVSAHNLLAVVRPALKLIGCVDTPGWHNPYGKSCADYATPTEPARRFDGSAMAGGWCSALNGLLPQHRWAGGAAFGWPERHCCACGRARQSSAHNDAYAYAASV